jgi:YD repeat-containing protein
VVGKPSSGTFSRDYDSAGRFYRETYPGGKQFTHELDANGNVTKTTWPDGYYVQRAYDELGRPTTVKLNGAGTPAISVGYDALSRCISQSKENGTSAAYVYEIDDVLSSLSHTFTSNTFALTGGASSPANAIANGNVNPLSSLTSSTLTYSYIADASGDQAMKVISDPQYRWAPSVLGTKAYGAADSVSQYPTVDGVAQAYNSQGSKTSDGTWTYDYNTEQQATSASKAGTSVSWDYDPNSRQMEKTVNGASSVAYFAGSEVMGDYDSAGTLQNRYVSGAFGEPGLQISSAGTKSFFHAEGNGSIVALSDAAGAVTNRFSYSPFGESAPLTGTPFGFGGARYEPSMDKYVSPMGATYEPTLGRSAQVMAGPTADMNPNGGSGTGAAPTSMNLGGFFAAGSGGALNPLASFGHTFDGLNSVLSYGLSAGGSGYELLDDGLGGSFGTDKAKKPTLEDDDWVNPPKRSKDDWEPGDGYTADILKIHAWAQRAGQANKAYLDARGISRSGFVDYVQHTIGSTYITQNYTGNPSMTMAVGFWWESFEFIFPFPGFGENNNSNAGNVGLDGMRNSDGGDLANSPSGQMSAATIADIVIDRAILVGPYSFPIKR